jgi:type I restriction enzyme R subunit
MLREGHDIARCTVERLMRDLGFSRRLEEAVARYHANAISALEMIQELIGLTKELNASRKRGEDLGLSPEEIAFYDALADNESAVEAMGNDKLRVIASELVDQLQSNVTVDWHKRESARARMRILVKRILKRYGYPPDLADEAVQTVLQQAELLLAKNLGNFSFGGHIGPLSKLCTQKPRHSGIYCR